MRMKKWKVKRCVAYAVTAERDARSQSFQDSAVNNKNRLAENYAENENEYMLSSESVVVLTPNGPRTLTR